MIDIINYRISHVALFIGVIGIIIAAIFENMFLLGIIAILPIVYMFLFCSIVNPILCWFFLFIINYLIMGVGRYISIPKVSIIMDVFLIYALLILCINGIKNKTIRWRDFNCILCIGTLVWCFFCFLEILNPTANIHAWFASKNLIYNPIILSIITMIAVTKRTYLRSFIYIFSILTLFAVIKTLMQKFIGFDQGELYWLYNSGSEKTHIISSGIRYFSIFTDASNMGSNMGYASFFFGVIGISCSKKMAKVGFLVLSVLCLYALVLSGTRGALIVPIGGVLAYAVLVRNTKLMILCSSALIVVYLFFAFTYIGHSNSNIRRMRSAFSPTKDASFLVRLENQEKLGVYLKDRWFGEGLGLAGVENQDISRRFTTSIPTDSWLVKIWVETGVVGLTLYIMILFAIFLNCFYIILFKVHDKQLKGLFIALIGGSFGLTLGSYGNLFFGQYPTHYIIYFGFAIVMNYKYYISNEESENRCLY